MNQYRIIKIEKGDKTHFEVQQKGLFFWNTETYFDCCIDGLCAGHYAYEFETIKEAELYIKDNLPVKKTKIYNNKYEFKKLHRNNFWIHFIPIIILIGYCIFHYLMFYR
jgi:hypothetical protein